MENEIHTIDFSKIKFIKGEAELAPSKEGYLIELLSHNTYRYIKTENMSRSKTVKKDLTDGHHLVAIVGVEKEGNQIVVCFADGKNRQVDKSYDFNSSEFIKMCHAAGTIKNKEIFNSINCIGKSLWITVSMYDVVEAFPYVEGQPFIKPKAELPPEKKKVIEEAREMIKTVESGTVTKTEDEDSI